MSSKVSKLTVALSIILGACSGGFSDEFRTDLNSFLVEGERLSTMTAQGVSYLEFRDQLVNAKSRFSLLQGRWPEQFAEEEVGFDRALLGWDLALRVWEYHIEHSPIYYFGDAPQLTQETADYLGAEFDVVRLKQGDELLPYILAESSQAFHDARTSIQADLD